MADGLFQTSRTEPLEIAQTLPMVVLNIGRLSSRLDQEEPREDTTFSMQILATTDLHMRLLPFDYLRDRPSGAGDLATLATLIDRLRAENHNTLLVDNGDFLQGTPMADVVAEGISDAVAAFHPAIAAMNIAEYDAAGIGNHEFDYGPTVLRAAMSCANFPFLCANLRMTGREQDHLPNLKKEVILERTFHGAAGQRIALRVGILGLTPPGAGSAENVADDMVIAAKAAVRRLREGAADIILALCHSGMPASGASRQDAILRIASIEGIDAIVGGHTHQPFPGHQCDPLPEVDATTGHICGKPAVAPGAFGSQLGRIVLDVGREGRRWRVAGSKVDLLSPTPSDVAAHPAIVRELDTIHQATRQACNQIVGKTLSLLHSLTPLLTPDPCLSLLARAQSRSVSERLLGSPWADLPLLSAVAPRQSPIKIETGCIRRRQVFELVPFPDRCCAIVATASQLRRWLARAASVFVSVQPGVRLQPLIDPDKPGYTFDILYGLTYRINLAPGLPRIADLRYRGIEVSDEDSFVVALSSHRLGEGSSDLFGGCPVVSENGDLLSTAIQNHLGEGPLTADNPPVWRFVPQPATSAWIEADEAILPDLTKDGPLRPVGQARQGIQRFEVDLSDRSQHFAPAAN
jgi:2',3'-cyclic-nucleotide 2'-phosphodiesterase/3'-nucleotidase